jgi:hypothetical protein
MPSEGDGTDFEAKGETVGTAHPLSFPRHLAKALSMYSAANQHMKCATHGCSTAGTLFYERPSAQLQVLEVSSDRQ